jgi:hypothetical protein
LYLREFVQVSFLLVVAGDRRSRYQPICGIHLPFHHPDAAGVHPRHTFRPLVDGVPGVRRPCSDNRMSFVYRGDQQFITLSSICMHISEAQAFAE